MAGRRAKLDKNLIDKITGYISNGLQEKDALCLAKVGHTAFYNWKKKGEADIEKGDNTTLQAELVNALKNAELNFEMALLQEIVNAGKVDWKANAWVLERKFPNKYAKVVRQQADETDTQKDDFNRLTDAIERLADKK